MPGPWICKEGKKVGRAYDEKCGEQEENARLLTENEKHAKQDPFQFVSIWFWSSRSLNIHYVFTKHEI